MRPRHLLIAVSLLFALPTARASTITESVLIHFSQTLNMGPPVVTFDVAYLLTFDPSLSYTDATDGLSLVSATSVNGDQYLPTLLVPTGFDYTPNSTLTIGGLALGVAGGNFGTDDFEVLIGLAPLITSHPTQYFPPPRIIQIEFASADPTLGGGFGILSNGGGSPSGTSVSITPVATAVTPEPQGLLLLATGLATGVAARRKAFAKAWR